MPKQRIGIYGGTFNPIHNAHLAIADHAHTALNLSRLLFIPAGIPPAKGSLNLVSGDRRLAMVSLAIAGDPRFLTEDFEIRREQKSFTIDTVRYLKERYPPDTDFFIILGDDCAAKLHHWKGIDELRQLVQFACIRRTAPEISQAAPPLLMLDMPPMDISSTQLRRRLAERRNVQHLVPSAVSAYIEKECLYQNGLPTHPESMS